MQNYDHVPVRVDYVVIDGLGRTKNDYAMRFAQDVFKARNFSELAVTASEACRKLESAGCFNKCNVVIDTNKREGASRNGFEVTFVVNEMIRFAGSVQTMIGSNEGSIVLSTRCPNVLGRGERIGFEHSFGSSSQKGSYLSFAKPIPQIGSSEVNFTLSQNSYTHHQGGFNMASRGGILDFFFHPFASVKHNLQWEGAWRDMESSSRKTSFAIREQSGHSFKSALKHIVTVDHRDQRIFPTQGIFLKIMQEFAGAGGDVAFLKNEAEFQLNVPLPLDTVLQTSCRLGLFHGLDDFPAYNSSDLFFLGGPQSLRGFDMRSLGPRSENNVLGGKTYWSTGLHLFGPLPFSLGKGSFGDYCRTHLFFNAGNLTDKSLNLSGDDVGANLQSLIADFKAAYGLGLAIRLGQVARVEINYCWPLQFTGIDKVVRGLQFGIGIDFL